jgi:hypothetical protein|tara:strand:+ start:19 stop:579 length:561 start_codon:yes stop_codon:yes gene_type:complete
MIKEDARKQFDEMTEQLGIVHTFSFDEAWDYVEYKKGQSLIHQPVSFFPSNYTKEQFQEGIMKVEKMMIESNQTLKNNDLEKVNPLKHSFADGCYIREIFNPKNIFLVTKIHKVSHPYFLLKGEMTIMSEDGEKRIKAPHYGITHAGTKRIIYTHEDCIFVTVHVTDETDIEKIEEEVIAKDFKGV